VPESALCGGLGGGGPVVLLGGVVELEREVRRAVEDEPGDSSGGGAGLHVRGEESAVDGST